MATSPIYNWPEPDNTDLVKNGALAIRTLGNAIDTTMGTMVDKSIVDAKGDLIAATANDTPARLAVGANFSTLIADSTASTGLKYSPLVAFDVYFSGTQAIASGTFVKVTLNTENYDTNSNFDPTTNYRFTPTIKGYYNFSAQIQWATSNTGNQFTISKNNVANGTTSGLAGSNQDSGALYQNQSGLLYMNGSTDYVEVFAAQTSGTSKNLSVGRFQGILVREA